MGIFSSQRTPPRSALCDFPRARVPRDVCRKHICARTIFLSRACRPRKITIDGVRRHGMVSQSCVGHPSRNTLVCLILPQDNFPRGEDFGACGKSHASFSDRRVYIALEKEALGPVATTELIPDLGSFFRTFQAMYRRALVPMLMPEPRIVVGSLIQLDRPPTSFAFDTLRCCVSRPRVALD